MLKPRAQSSLRNRKESDFNLFTELYGVEFLSVFVCRNFFFAILDAVIIGGSSVKHLEENLKSTKHGPLHEGIS